MKKESIAQAILRNREAGAARLVAEYRDRLYSIGFSLCRDRAEAEDLVFRTIERAVEKIENGTYEERDSFGDWIQIILLNLYRDSIRRKSARNTIPSGGAEELENGLDSKGDVVSYDGARVVYDTVDSAILRDAIDTLPQPMKEVVLLHYFVDIPLSRMAQILATPAGTLKSRLRLARKVLAMRLGEKARKPVVAMLAALVVVAVSATVAISVVRGIPGGPTSPSSAMATGGPRSCATAATAGGSRLSRPAGGPTSVPDTTPAEGSQFIATASPSAATVATNATRPSAICTNEPSTTQEGMQTMNIANLTKAAAPAVAAAAIVASAPVIADVNMANPAYIESDGDCLVSLSYCAGPQTKIELDFQLTDVSDAALQTRLLGAAGNGTVNPLFVLYLGDAGDSKPRFSWECSSADGTRQAANLNLADLERRTIAFDCATATYTSSLGGEIEKSYTFQNPVSARESSLPMGVFAACSRKNASSEADFISPAKMKVYGVRIYESGTLVRDFVPCIKGGIAGFKDRSNGVFVTGVDVSKVKYGGDILVERDAGHIDLENAIVERENGKSMRIDVDYAVKPSTRIELDYALLTPEWSGSEKFGINPHLLSAGASSGPVMDLWIFGRGDGCFAYTLDTTQYYGGNRGEIANMCIATAYGVRRTVSVSSNSIVFATAGCTNAVGTGGPVSGAVGSKIVLGSRFDALLYLPLRVYGLKIYENDSLVKNFVPFVTNGVAGLMDEFEPSVACFPSTFNGGGRTNLMAVAGGDFDMHTGVAESESYLEFNGDTGEGGIVDTGCTVTKDSVVDMDFSLWNTRNLPESGGTQEFILQDGSNGILASLYINSEQNFSYRFKDFTDATAENTKIKADNFRKRFTFDGPNGILTIKEGDSTLYSQPMVGERTRTAGSKTLKIGSRSACMRLYGFKITTDGATVRDYIPYVNDGQAGLYDLCTKTFAPLAGGKVSGAKHRGVAFQEPPRDAKVTKKENDTPTLYCKAAGAQSYEWYADGRLVENETNDTLIVNWRKLKEPYKVAYSVVPVYTVFSEMLKGEPATAVVTMPPKGTALILK